MPSNKFMFATGIENNYPTIVLPDGTHKRVDEMEKTGHYTHWQQDFELVKEMGIHFLRYGPPYYKTHLGPGKYDWTFTNDTFHRLRNLTTILSCPSGVFISLKSFNQITLPEMKPRCLLNSSN